MAGYSGYSKSNNAIKAEREGKMNKTQLLKWCRDRGLFPGLTTKIIAKVLRPCEWHHTSKHYNATNYYSVEELYERRHEVRSYIRTEKEPEPVQAYFKCWNTDADIRRWDWKVTNRYGNHCSSLESALEMVQRKRAYYEAGFLKDPKPTKATIRVYQERMKAIERIEASLTPTASQPSY